MTLPAASYFALLTSVSCNVTPSIVKVLEVLENSLPFIDTIASVPAVTAAAFNSPFSKLSAPKILDKNHLMFL